MPVRGWLSAAGIAAGLAGCSLAPHSPRPARPDPPPLDQETAGWKLATPADTAPRGAWWQQFGEPQLNALEDQVDAANQSLKAALARLEQARAQTRVARAAWFPSLTARAAATRAEASTYAPGYTPGKPRSGDSLVAAADLAYEADLFGRIRNTVAGARATQAASAGDVAALKLALQAELASDYFSLRGLDAQQELLDRTLADYQRALQLTQNLYHGGAAAIADVQQAQTQLETARTQAEDTSLRRAQIEHAIAVLTGNEASRFALAVRSGAPHFPAPVIDPGLPSQLLERRPDVAAAERRVAAATAAVGVARAAYFPVFSLAAAAGTQATTSANWFSAPSQFWSIGPQALLTVFDAGVHAAQSAAAHAAYDEQVANYRGTVLTAYQEVEDNLAALRQFEHENVSQAAAVEAAQGALRQANLRYRGGIVTSLEVVTTENAALAAQLAAVDIQVRRVNAAVLLIRALGGDWRETTQ
ncbi:MAG: efflux transporter outer membrane subunit [Steroidobacteraceae bacterium]